MKITAYEALCNLGGNIDEIYQNAICGNINCFENIYGYITDDFVHAGIIKSELPVIKNENYNIRCNRLLLKNLELLQTQISELIKKYSKNRIGIIAASTNSGVDEYEKTNNPKHFELGNPALFLKEELNLNGFYTTVSTACSSGLKAFSLANDLLESNIADAIIIACTDSLSKVPVYGFNSLEVLSDNPTNPFGKNRSGMNMGEASAIFIVEKKSSKGIKIMGIGESSDVYHQTTPDPEGKEAINAIQKALKDAKINPYDVDYINAHGTGTIANDMMEANAIYSIFSDIVPVSSTKPMTGHCLGAAAGIETALCCKLIDNFDGRLYPNIYDGKFDNSLPKINLVQKNKNYKKCNICMCNSFGFSGTNVIMIVGR